MADSAIQETVKTAEKFWVIPELCIACDACCQDFPEVFYMGGDQKAHAHEQHQWDLYNARTVVDVCPTAAIKFSGELPPAEEAGKLEEVPGWELEWSNWRGVEEDVLERDRRYGRDFSIEERAGHVLVAYNFPTRIPAVQNRFKFGLGETMPLYRSHVQLTGKTLLVAGWLTEPKVRSLCHTSKSFPAQFINTLDFTQDIIGMATRYDARARLEVVLFTDPVVMETWQWKSHLITDKCTACTICERVCPTNAITSGEIFYIDPELCINCSVCGVYCPFDAIDDSRDVTVARIKAKQIPKAVVHEETCTGCEFCVDVCPFEALEMRPVAGADTRQLHLPQTSKIAYVIEKNCVSCKLCEQVCIKDAIEVPRQHQFEDIGMSFMHYVTDNH
ncbi:MAG: 4Fe-4S dicluster domain-containing protein [Planctomycetes bacterium]|nr:4Fe-4S dicluster domain-containing protein [Planctomycetota bacterium]